MFNSAAPNTLGRLIAGGILQPLNKSYIPNFSNVLPSFVDPWYDEGSTYTVPYTVFSSGIAYRTDRIDPAKVDEMGWDILWDPTYKGVTSILDDYREGIAMALLRKGITDVNTTDEALIEQAGADLVGARRPDEHQGQHRGLQGHPRRRHRPRPHLERRHAGGRLLVPARGHRPVGARLVVPGRRRRRGQQRLHGRHRRAPRTRCSPTSGSTTCSMSANAEENFSWNGYLPPIKGLDADYLIANEYAPENLRAAVLDDDDHREGSAVRTARRRDRPALGTDLVVVHRRLTRSLPTATTDRQSVDIAAPTAEAAPAATARGPGSGRRWRRPARCWLIALFVVPGYAILAVAFGGIDPVLRTTAPAWNPLDWDFGAMGNVLDRVFGGDLGHVFVRTGLFAGARAGRVLRDRLPGRLLRRAQGRPVAWAPARRCSCCRSGSAT